MLKQKSHSRIRTIYLPECMNNIQLSFFNNLPINECTDNPIISEINLGKKYAEMFATQSTTSFAKIRRFTQALRMNVLVFVVMNTYMPFT